MGFRPGNIGNRRTIGIYAHRTQFLGHDPGAQAQDMRSVQACSLCGIKGRRPLTPIGGPHPLHAPAFLIDQDRRVTPNRSAQIAGQPDKLIGVFDVAGKEDKAKRVTIPEKSALI
jgi:hypothetical protein